MPATHRIDPQQQLILTRWHGPVSADGLIEALRQYQQLLAQDPKLYGYHELVDFSQTSEVNLNTESILQIARFASRSDALSKPHKLAFVANTNLAYGLARMYVAYRSIGKRKTKQVQAFRTLAEAQSWLNQPIDKAG